MGVVGAGKTLIGTLLAEQMGWRFADADDYHTPENKEKMHRGIALTDADRTPWLEALHRLLAEWGAHGFSGVLACSALKSAYRQQLSGGLGVNWVYLKGDPLVIEQRLRERHGHFADEKILKTQIETLEEPGNAVVVDVSRSPTDVLKEIKRQLQLQP